MNHDLDKICTQICSDSIEKVRDAAAIMASIEALAMAGANYLECVIPFEEYVDNDPPQHLLADVLKGNESLWTITDYLVR